MVLRVRCKPMQSQMQQLFRAALGLAEPWVVSKIDFSDEQHQLDIYPPCDAC